ncbi:protein AHNAK2 [Octodon degus]|uniref:Protein AHNAK2 n=1 Tax=Octodon degus TaxID=10160 RepID=A0A6P6DNB6_OCTDE|nr:protein AHNAK2 [Octodon degus]
MSRPETVQEATEVTLKTEVEVGASGYSVTGGGEQGIFVKQVLKDSSAAKIFNLREGDQLLSATIFFDDIKYEDALKILQYSEPYKVQFQIKRRFPVAEDKSWALHSPQHQSEDKKQGKEVVDGCGETPKKTVEEDGDREKLIEEPREVRGRRPRDRLSWPKFQGVKGKQRSRPQRSHSSSEACEHEGAREVSPTSTDTEAQFPAEHREKGAGQDSQRRKGRLLSLGFRRGLRPEPSATGHQDTEVLGGLDASRVLEEKLEDTGAGGGSQETAQIQKTRPGLATKKAGDPISPAQRGGAAGRQQRKKKLVKATEELTGPAETGALQTLATEKDDEWEDLTNSITEPSFRDTEVTEGTWTQEKEIQVRIHAIKTPKFSFYSEKAQEMEDKTQRGHTHKTEMTCRSQAEHEAKGQAEIQGVCKTQWATGETELGEKTEFRETQWQKKDGKEPKEMEEDRGGFQMKKSRFKMTAFGWSPTKEKKTQRLEKEVHKQQENFTLTDAGDETKGEMLSINTAKEDMKSPTVDLKRTTAEGKETKSDIDLQATSTELQGEVCTKDSKFKMPKFKMPSFGMMAPSKTTETSLEVSRPNLEANVSPPTFQVDVNTPEASAPLPSADIDLQSGQLGIQIPEGALPKVELSSTGSGVRLKGHLPKVQIPSIKLPEVGLKGPKEDVKGAKGYLSGHELEVSLPGAEVDLQAPSTKQEAEVSVKDSKFKMPKFKMPSFGMTARGKTIEGSLEVSKPKLEADVSLPAVPVELKTPDTRAQLPGTDVALQAPQLGVQLPEKPLPEEELPGAGLKGHLPKVHMPSIKMPKVDLKGPQVDMKGPKVEVKGAKGDLGGAELEVSLPGAEVDLQAISTELEGEVCAKDSKFKMPKFKMPSFSVTVPGETIETSLVVSAPKLQADKTLPGVQVDLKTPEASTSLSSADFDMQAGQMGIKLPEAALPEADLSITGARSSLKGHLPKVEMPSIKLPKVEIKGPKEDVRSAKGDRSGQELEVSLPGAEVDLQAPSTKLEAKESVKDSKFKMPKFKMPSFGVTAAGKTTEDSPEVYASKLAADVSLSAIQVDLKTPETTASQPSADIDLQTGQLGGERLMGALHKAELSTTGLETGQKGHLPKVQMPSIKRPKVELKGSKEEVKGAKGDVSGPKLQVSLPGTEVDLQAPSTKREAEGSVKDSKFKMPKFKMPSFSMTVPGQPVEASLEVSTPKLEADGPKVEVKGAKGDLGGTKLEVCLPGAEVDLQAISTKLEGEVCAKDSKFQMPKFKMPSGVMTPGKSTEASLEVSTPKLHADVSLPAIQVDLKTPEVSAPLPSTDSDLWARQLGIQIPEGALHEEKLSITDSRAGLKGHLPKVQMPSIKLPKVELKGRKADVRDTKGDLSGHELEMSMPGAEMDLQAPKAKQEAEISVKDSKFKMPKFKMPSFGMTVPEKTIEGSMEVSTTKLVAYVSLPAVQGDLKIPEASAPLPSADTDLQAGQLGIQIPEGAGTEVELSNTGAGAGLKGHVPKMQMPSIEKPKVELKGTKMDGALPEAELSDMRSGAGLKGHLPKLQMPSIKLPEVELKGPKQDMIGGEDDLSGPELEVSLPGHEVALKAPSAKLEAKVSVKDSKFKMPKFKMPSFGMTAPGKTIEGSLEVSAPKMETDVSLPDVQVDLKTPEDSTPLPYTDIDLQAGQLGGEQPTGSLPKAELSFMGASAGWKGDLPKMQMPSIKMPKVELKGAKVDVKGSKGKLRGSELGVSLPGTEVDLQAPSAKQEAEVSVKDSKFKMPKFKMPSFGMTAPGKTIEGSLEVSAPQLEADVPLPAIPVDLKTPDTKAQLPGTDVALQAPQLGVQLPEKPLPEDELPGIKMPKVDLKGPRVDLKGPKVEVKGTKGDLGGAELEVLLPCTEVDLQAISTELEGEVCAKDSKFKMPKFKMPSFGMTAPGETIEGSLEVSAPKLEADVSLPAIQVDLKSPEVSAPLPSTDTDLQAGQLGIQIPEGTLPEAELSTMGSAASMKGYRPKVQMPSIKLPKVNLKQSKADVTGTKGDLGHEQEVWLPGAEVDLQEELPGAGLKGHLPKVHMPSMKMSKVDLKGPQVNMKGPKVEVKGSRGDVSGAEREVSLPGAEVDIQAISTELEGEVCTKDSKFKMPNFKMPSFGVMAPGKTFETSLEVSAVQLQADVSLPSVLVELKTSEASTSLSSADTDLQAGQQGIQIPEGALPEVDLSTTGSSDSLKRHLPQVHMPSIRLPKGELKEPNVDVKGAKGDLSGHERDVSLPGSEVDLQAPSAKLEAEVSVKDSKFKMPKFKMPSFGVMAPGKTTEGSLEVSAPKLEANVSLPDVQVDLKTPEASTSLSSADLDLQAGQKGVELPEAALFRAELPATVSGAGLKRHLPKVQMPSIKLPEVELKGPKEDVKGTKGDLSGPELEGSLPGAKVALQAPSAKQEAKVSVKDSKFKMPKFKMPSFGMTASGKTIEGSLEVSAPKLEADVSLPAIQVDLKTPEDSAPLPSDDIDLQAEQLGREQPRGALPEAHLSIMGAGVGLKGHLPKVQMPSIKMPKVELKGTKADGKGSQGKLSGSEIEVSLPGTEVDLQAPSTKQEAEVSVKDSKFKMPKFKMPLDLQAISTELEGEVCTKDSKFKMPKFKMPSFGMTVPGKTIEGSLEVSAPKLEADVSLPAIQVDLKTPEARALLSSADFDLQAGQMGVELPKGALPELELSTTGSEDSLKGHLPKVQMPRIKLPKVELKGPKEDVNGPKGNLSGHELEVSLPGTEVDLQAPSAKQEAEVLVKDSKFKMPKFRMPSFGMMAPGKSNEASLEVSAPKLEADVSLPAIPVDLKTPDTRAQLPCTDVDFQTPQVGVPLPETALPEAELPGADLKGHLPMVQMPSMKMPKVDLKVPQVDMKGPMVEVKGSRGDLGVTELEVSLPGAEVDLQAISTELEGEVCAKDSKFKMPKFKKPSFSVTSPGETIKASLEVSSPKLETNVSLPAVQVDLKTPEVSPPLPSTDIDLQAEQLGGELPTGALPKAELSSMGSGAGLKGHLPKVQMPNIKMPKVEQRGTKAEVKGSKGKLSGSELQVSLPGAKVDLQAPSAKQEAEVSVKDSKFKMPKFKMPSFGVTAPSKTIEALLEVSPSKLEADVSLPTVQVDLKTPEASAVLPCADMELSATQPGLQLPDNTAPEAELPGASLKGHLCSVHLQSIQLSKVELKGPKADMQGPEGNAVGPELEASLPGSEVDLQDTGSKVEGELSVSTAKMPTCQILDCSVNTPCRFDASQELCGTMVETEMSLPVVHLDVKSSEASAHLLSTDVELHSGNLGWKPSKGVPLSTELQCASLKAHPPGAQMPSIMLPKVDLKGPQGDLSSTAGQCVCECSTDSDVSLSSGKDGSKYGFTKSSLGLSAHDTVDRVFVRDEAHFPALLDHSLSPQLHLASAEPLDAAVSRPRPTIPSPKLTLSDLPSCNTGSIEPTLAQPEPSVFPPTEGVMLTPLQGPAVFTHGAPWEAASLSLVVAPSVGSQSSVDTQTEQAPQAALTGHHSHPEGLLSPRVTFPKFHKPRFMVSFPRAVAPEGDPGTTEWGLVPPLCQALGQDSSSHSAKASQLPGSWPAPRAALLSQKMGSPWSPSAGGAVAEGAEGEGARGPFKTRFKLPLFSRSPKKEARSAGDTSCHLEDHSGSLAMGLDHEAFHPGVQGSHTEANIALPPGKEGDVGRTRKAGLALPRLALPKFKASKGQAELWLQGDTATVLSHTGDCDATESSGSKGSVSSSGHPEGPQEAGHMACQVSQPLAPSVGLANPDLQSFPAKEGESQCEAVPRRDLMVGGDSQGSGLLDVSASQPCGEGTAPTMGEPLKPSLGYRDQVFPQESPEESPTAEGTAADSQEHSFKMPKLRRPSFGQPSSKERSGTGEQSRARLHVLVATAPAQAAAASSVLAVSPPGSGVEASVSWQPPNTEAAATGPGSASYADVLKRDLHCSGLKPHPPSVGKTRGDQPLSKAYIYPAEGSVPLQKPSRRPLESQAPAAREEKTELWPSLPEGPVTLRVSSTDVPSQVSMVDMQQLWEDSVLTVTFPKLKVPRFSFPAPGSEVDIFFPVVRDVRGVGAGEDPGPGLWDASLLRAGPREPREQPMGSTCTSDASPVSKVKAHIQGVQGESHKVMVYSQAMQESVELMVPKAFPTHIVRESEVPTSTVQIPSYGFSLLKLKTLGPPTQAPDPRVQEGSAATRVGSVPEGCAPEATEPFEEVSVSTSLPEPWMLRPGVPAKPPPADGGSDDEEEPAETLEFLPEESGEAAAPLAAEDGVPKGGPEGTKTSGMFWSWLPSIGFSSSVSEAPAGPREDAQRSVPVQTQPGPRPDLEPPKRQERVGWFRFPKLGFSSSPTKQVKSTEDEAGLAEPTRQEESTTFFDARESFTPEEKEGEPAASTPDTTAMVASSARTELILLEPDTCTSKESAPRPMSK